jgi:Uma2 family endonuclease
MLEQVKQAVGLHGVQQMESGDMRVEVEDGQIITDERTMTILHLLIIRVLFRMLDTHVVNHKLGEVFMDGVRFRLKGSKDDIIRAYKPDLAFVRAARIAADLDLNDDFPGAPGLAVAVVSPGQTNAAILKKISRCLEAGTEEAWLIYPAKKQLYRYRGDADAPEVYSSGDTMQPKALFSGLSVSLEEVFDVSLGR